MAKDHELSWLLDQLEDIKHIRRLRIHTRLPVVILPVLLQPCVNGWEAHGYRY